MVLKCISEYPREAGMADFVQVIYMGNILIKVLYQKEIVCHGCLGRENLFKQRGRGPLSIPYVKNNIQCRFNKEKRTLRDLYREKIGYTWDPERPGHQKCLLYSIFFLFFMEKLVFFEFGPEMILREQYQGLPYRTYLCQNLRN